MNNTIKLLVDKKNINKRVDIFLADKIKFITRSYIKKLIINKNFKINKKIVFSPSTKIKNKR